MNTIQHVYYQKKISIELLMRFGLSIIVLLYPLLGIAHLVLGKIIFLGVNLFIALPVLFITFSFLCLIKKMPSMLVTCFFVMFFSYLILTILAILFYDYGVDELVKRRYFLFFFMAMVLLFHLLENVYYRRIFLKLFFIAIIGQCFLGIVHHHFFGNIIIDVIDEVSQFLVRDESIGAGRESGTVMSSSAFAYILLNALIVLTYVKNLPWKLDSVLYKLILMFILFYGILLSGSRGPSIAAILVISTWVFFSGKKGITVRGFIFCLGILLFLYFQLDEKLFGFAHRFRVESSGGRDEKLKLVFLMLSEGWYCLLGVPAYIQQTTLSNGVTFSDNSFGTLLLNFGITGLLPIVVLFYGAKFFLQATRLFLPVFVGFLCLATTNSILWDAWIFYYIAALILIYFSHKDNQQIYGVKNKVERLRY
tara:strand:- start:259 stop:1524 length:1266 start_codon:yes stop_codon:yes gene_type:complete